MYSDVVTKVRINRELSEPFHETRGIRQGGETSTDGYKAKDNNFLASVRTHPSSLKIGQTSCGIPTVADDNCMLSASHRDAQVQLLMAQTNASKIRYIYSQTKSKVLS